MKRFSLLLSVEFYYSIFLFSGYFKESINIGIDLTVIALLITLVLSIINILQRPSVSKRYIVPIIIFASLYLVLLVSIYYSPSVSSLDKVIKFTFLTITAFLVPLLTYRGIESLRKTAITITVISLLYALSVIPLIITNAGNVGFVGDQGQYQSLGRMMGIGSILLIFYFYLKGNKKTKIIGLISLGFCIIVLFTAGSRMPIIAFILAGLYYVFTSFKIKRGRLLYRKEMKWIFVLLFLTSPAFVFLYQNGYFETILYRFEVLMTEKNGGVSANGRIEAFKTAFETWKDYPFLGNGIGSFGLIFYGFEFYDYPHNIILELMMEQGLVGIIVFLTLLFVVLVKSISLTRSKDPIYYVWTLVFVYFLFNSFVSGDINSNRMLFAAMSFVLIAHNDYKTRYKSEKTLKGSIGASKLANAP
ncbi:O-antigen ligase family protein [Sporosarcina sp. ITBMC105]